MSFNMKRKYLIIVALVFILFVDKTIAQKQEIVFYDPEIQKLLGLSESVQSGEISFVVNEEKKGELAVETNEYQVRFFKTGIFLRLMLIYDIHYNLLNIKDSMQYVYNGKAWYIIDHKNKICTIDTNYYYTNASQTPLALARLQCILDNNLFNFYRGGDLMGPLLSAVTIEEMQKNGNMTFLKIETKDYKEVLFTEEYEWDTSKSLLLRHSKTVKDDNACSEKDIVKTETRLINASINDEKYRDADLYNGLNFAKSYKIEYRDSKDE